MDNRDGMFFFFDIRTKEKANAPNGFTMDSFFPPFIYRYKDKGTRDKESQDERPINACGTDEDDVAKYDPKKDEKKCLRAIETITHK